MRLVVAMMSHETNTFSPVPTPLSRFARGMETPGSGDEVYEAFKVTGSGLGAFFDLAEEAGAEMVIPIAASAWPSGPVHDDAYEAICDSIVGAVKDGCDAIMLVLHGAMVTQSREDGEGELLRRIREVAPDTPLAISLDMHTNMYQAIAENVDILAGYQTYPHIDGFETAMRAGKPLLDMIAGKINRANHGKFKGAG